MSSNHIFDLKKLVTPFNGKGDLDEFLVKKVVAL